MLHRLSPSLRRAATIQLATAVRRVSTGSVDITVPLNFWAGKRRTSQGKAIQENVYEPATGKPLSPLIVSIVILLLTLLTHSVNWTLITAARRRFYGDIWPGILTNFDSLPAQKMLCI